MPRSPVFLCALIIVTMPSWAPAQVVIQSAPTGATGGATPAGSDTPHPLSVDAMVTRLMAFDTNADGRVASAELPERMRGLVDRGDADGDNALATREVRDLAQHPPAVVHLFSTGGYGFFDEAGLTSRHHIEGAIEDLRLGTARTAQALAVATSFSADQEADARAALLSELEDVLIPERLAQFKAAMDRPTVAATRLRNIPVRPWSLLSGYALSPEQRMQAFGAAKRYEAHLLHVNDEQRAALLTRMSDVLDPEEHDDLRAALERRPVVERGTSTVTTDALRTIVSGLQIKIRQAEF